MEEGPLSLKRAFREGFAAFKKQPGMSLGGFLIGDLLGGMFWPFIGGPMVAGTCVLFLKIARGENAEIGDLFSCFKDFWKWTGIFWSLVAVVALLLIPFIGVMVFNVVVLSRHETTALPLFFIVYIGAILLFQLARIGVLAKCGLAFFEGLESEGVDEAFNRSFELTKGRWLRLWWMLVVLGLFGLAGLFACYFGVVITTAISMNIATAIYLELKRLEMGTSETAQAVSPAESE